MPQRQIPPLPVVAASPRVSEGPAPDVVLVSESPQLCSIVCVASHPIPAQSSWCWPAARLFSQLNALKFAEKSTALT